VFLICSLLYLDLLVGYSGTATDQCLEITEPRYWMKEFHAEQTFKLDTVIQDIVVRCDERGAPTFERGVHVECVSQVFPTYKSQYFLKIPTPRIVVDRTWKLPDGEVQILNPRSTRTGYL
jgi:hypothetical protein